MAVRMNDAKKKSLITIRKTLRELKKADKKQLSRETGLNCKVLNSLLKMMNENSEITEEKDENNVIYSFNTQKRLALLIFSHEKNGEDTVYFSVCDMSGNIIDRIEMKIGTITPGSFSPIIKKMKAKYPEISLINFSMPAQEFDGEMVICDYSCIRDFDFRGYINRQFSVPVLFENDINAAVYGHYKNSSETDKNNIIAIYFPAKYSPGAGVLIDGKIVKGNASMSGEITFMPFDVDWNKFSFSEEDVDEPIVKYIKSFMCFCNPDKIVIYIERNNTDYTKMVEEICPSDIEKAMIPEIIVSGDLNRDYETGLACLAADALLEIV